MATVKDSADGEKAVIEVEEHATKGTSEDEIAPVTSAYAGFTRGALIRKFKRLYVTGLMVALGGVYAGYCNSVIGSIVANRGFIQAFATVHDPKTGKLVLDAQHVSIWAAVNYASQITFQFISPFTADRFGRKFNMWVFTFFLTLSIILAIVAQNYIVLALSRVAGGCASGMISTACMVYMSEIALPQFRGAMLGAFSLAFALGQVFLAIGLKTLDVTAPYQFRRMFYSEFVFFGLWLVPVIYLPETPAWYATKGRHEEGKKALHKLVGNVEGYDLDREYGVVRFEAEKSIALAKSHGNSDWSALFTKNNIKRIIVATLPFTFQNFVGVALIFGFTTYFFQLANLKDPFLGKIIIQLVLLTGLVVSFYFVDKVGRRKLVIWGGVVLGIICFIVGGLGFREQTSASGVGLIVLCAVWAFVYANSMAPIGWISLVEVSSPQLRAKTTACAAIIQACTGLIFSYTVPIMLSNQGAGWGQKIGLFFGGITFVYLLPVIFFYPETKNRTYEELDELFERGIPAWKFETTKTRHQTAVAAERTHEP
ncbi:hypothetical protein LTR84_005930 [Exophiala bonariae]|uniref:Major facilitator superfamily (MFS) profile domain-containing protein n=1 Tax=Exophiala bonariae TaxID=1690606 RepID=A0AAV9N2Q9_9EURO|nr:hypothetical protein LTR84_005930 [Exophiala bonariae]